MVMYTGVMYMGAYHVHKYVDNFLVVLKESPEPELDTTIMWPMSVFSTHSQGVTFTREVPTNGEHKFLAVRIFLLEESLRLMYNPRSRKGLLSFDRAHSKLVN